MISIIPGCICHAQPTVPADFVETPAPKEATAGWYKLNNSNNEFEVANENGKLIVSKVNKISKINIHELQLPNGKLVAKDKGEWGGELTFVPVDTNQQAKKIKQGNVKYVFHFNNGIYFIEGLAHMRIRRGALYKLDNKDQQLSYSKIIDIEDAPEAFTIFGDKILIASHAGFYIVQNFEKKQIIKEAFWNSLYPNSIAAFDDKNIFIGIRGAIIKLDLLTSEIKLYKHIN